MSRSIRNRLAKLEQFRAPPCQYVFHVSDLPTRQEQQAIESAIGSIVITPHPCRTVEEWVAKYGPKGTLQ